MCQRLYNKNAIVTGAARGMGFAIAKTLVQEGARVALIDIDERAVIDAARQLDRDHGRTIGSKVDVTNRTEVNALI